MHPTVPMILMIRTKMKKGNDHGALNKSRKVLAAIVDAQLQIDKQRTANLIKPVTDPSK